MQNTLFLILSFKMLLIACIITWSIYAYEAKEISSLFMHLHVNCYSMWNLNFFCSRERLLIGAEIRYLC